MPSVPGEGDATPLKDTEHEQSDCRGQTLVVHHAHRVYHLQPGLSRSRQLQLRPAAGINEDLGITKGMASLLGALFFLGYFFFQIPGAIYAERRSVKN